MKYVFITIIILMVLQPELNFAQTGLQFNSSSPDDPRIIFINPALCGQAHSQIVMGYETFYLGLGENFANKFVGLTQHLPKWGNFGLTGQFFNSNIFNKSMIDFNYNRPFLNDKLDIGVKIGLLGISLNRDKFELADPNDPILNSDLSTYQRTFGFGLLFKPLNRVLVGLAVQNLNQPNISPLGGDAREPVNTNLSVMYNHPVFKPVLGFERAQNQTYFHFGIDYYLLNQRAVLKATYAPEDFGCGAAYQLKNLRLDYEYKYPLTELSQITSGTHQFIVSYLFPKADVPVEVPDFKLEIQPVSPEGLELKGIYPGQAAEYRIQILPNKKFAALTNLSLANLPAGITARPGENAITPAQATQLDVRVMRDCQPGEYVIHIIGHSGELQREAQVVLKVQPLPSLKAVIDCEPSVLKITKIQEIHEESPLLNYVFFAENSNLLDSDRYEILNPDSRPDGFVFFPDSVTAISEQYKNTLNLIAHRLQQYPDARILLIGCNADYGKEKNNTALSSQRALAVKNYFVRNCGIAEERIQIQIRNLPEDYSTGLTDEGRAENRRVEILAAAGSEKIIEPHITVTSQIVTSDSLCRFLTHDSESEIGLKSWCLKIENRKDGFMKTFMGADNLPGEILWDWKDDTQQPVVPERTYTYQLTLIDHLDQTAATPEQTITIAYEEIVQQHQPRTQKVEKTRLFLFKFDKDSIDIESPRLKKRLDQLTEKIRDMSGAKVILKGFTDIIGSDKYNLDLSRRRALTIRNELVKRHILPQQIEAHGYGKKSPLMDNSLPEGRMMNRRVEVYIEQPLAEKR